MNTESHNVLLLGIGETGLGVTRIIDEDDAVSAIKACGIKKESELKKLANNVIKEAELVILVADLGDKKDNSLAIQVAKSAKEMGKTVAAFLTVPRLFEGERAIMQALEAAQKMGGVVDASLIINLETFNTPPDGRCSFAELINSLVAVEETIADAIQSIMSLISESGAIDIDLQDLKTTLAESGTFTIASGIGAGENRFGIVIEDALSSPLMKKCEISTSRRVLIKVLAPKNKPLSMEEMKAISEFIETLPPRADVKWGVGESDDENLVSVIILAAGFDVKLPEEQ